MCKYIFWITLVLLPLQSIGQILTLKGAHLMWKKWFSKHLCVLIHIWTKGEVGAPLNWFKPAGKIFLLTVPRRCFFYGSFMLFLSCFVMLSLTSVCWWLVVTCWERADLLALVCDVYLWRCHFPIGILGQVWCLIVLFPDLCPLSYFTYLKELLLKERIRSLWGQILSFKRSSHFVKGRNCRESLPDTVVSLWCA